MIIWLVLMRFDHEGDNIEGVFSTLEAAEDYARTHAPTHDGRIVVQEWELDGRRRSSTDPEWDDDPEPDDSGAS